MHRLILFLILNFSNCSATLDKLLNIRQFNNQDKSKIAILTVCPSLFFKLLFYYQFLAPAPLSYLFYFLIFILIAPFAIWLPAAVLLFWSFEFW